MIICTILFEIFVNIYKKYEQWTLKFQIAKWL